MPGALLEKRLLQAAIMAACFVPVAAGLGGIVGGIKIFGLDDINADSHFRYLSGLLLGIGIGFLSSVPGVENKGARVRLLTMIVVVGGFARLFALVVEGAPDIYMQLALVMELVVTPLLCLWQMRVAGHK